MELGVKVRHDEPDGRVESTGTTRHLRGRGGTPRKIQKE